MIRSRTLFARCLCWSLTILVILVSSSGLVLAAQQSENELELTDPDIFSTEADEPDDIPSIIEEIDEEISDCCLPEEISQELNSLDPFLAGLDVYGHIRVFGRKPILIGSMTRHAIVNGCVLVWGQTIALPMAGKLV